LKIKTGSWEFSTVYRDCLVAFEWHKDPEEFWNMSEETQAVMIAFVESKGSMEYMESQQSSKES
jgi:hypothetical protein